MGGFAMYWRLKSIPELQRLSPQKIRRIVSYANRTSVFHWKTWLSGLVMLPPMITAYLLAHRWLGEQPLWQQLLVQLVGIVVGQLLARVFTINGVLRERIHTVLLEPAELHRALHDERHLESPIDTIATFGFVSLVIILLFLMIYLNRQVG